MEKQNSQSSLISGCVEINVEIISIGHTSFFLVKVESTWVQDPGSRILLWLTIQGLFSVFTHTS